MDKQEREHMNILCNRMLDDYEWTLATAQRVPLRWKGTQRALCEWAHHVSFDAARRPFNKDTGRLLTYTRVLKDLCRALDFREIRKPTNVYYECCLRKNPDNSFLACYGRLLSSGHFIRPILAYLRIPEKQEQRKTA